MHKRKPIIATAAVAGTVLTLVGGTMFTLETRWFSDFLSDKLSSTFGQEVEWKGPLHIDWSLSPTVRVEQLRVDNPDWAQHDHFVAADQITARIELLKLVKGVVAVDFLQLEQPRAHLMQSAEFGSNWAMFISEDKPTKDPMFTVKLRELMVLDGQVTYLEPAENTDLSARITSPGGEQLRIIGDGQLQGEPLQLRVNGDPLTEVVTRAVDRAKPEPASAYSLIGRFEWKDHQLRLDGTTGSLTELKQLQFDLSVAGPNARALSQLAGADAYAAPYQLQANVEHEQNQWTISDLSGEMGESSFRGEMRYDTSGSRPSITADVDISEINLDRLSTDPDTADVADTPRGQQALMDKLHQMLAPLRQYDAEIVVDVGQLQKQQIVVQKLHADVMLEDGTLTVEPLRFTTGGGQVLAKVEVNASPEVPKGEAIIQLESVDLGQALAPAGYKELGTLTGEINTQLDNQALLVLDSHLHYWEEQSATDVEATITARETTTGEPGIQVNGSGKVNGSEVELELTGGPLLDINSTSKPYPLEAMLTHAQTTISAEGTLTQPLRLSDADLQLRAEGPNPAQLNQLVQLDLPHLPQYELSGHFLREDSAWYVRDIRADVGASDLAGNVRWAKGDDERLMVWADLHSQELHLDTLTSNSSSQTSAEPSGTADQNNEDEQVIPDEELPNKTLQSFDAHVEYNGKRVMASGIPLDNIKADLTLQDGVLLLTPLSFGVGDGTVEFSLRANTNVAPPEGHVDLDVARVHINDLLARFDLADESFGLLGGQGGFDFTGDSLAQALAGLDGQMHLIMNGGRLDATLVEAIGLDAGELMFGLFGSEPDPVKVQCAYAKFNADDGVADIEALTIATTDSNILGDGQFNLEQETFELVIEAHPKDFSIVSGSSPIRLHGTFSEPQIDVVSDELVARGALAAIGAAIFPPAALIPLVELGQTEGTNGCEQAVASAESVASQQAE